MKTKAFTILAALVAVIVVACTSGKKADATALPSAASEVIAKHFGDATVVSVKVDRDALGIEGYDVLLSNGDELDFDDKGRIEEIDCKRSGKVPDALVPQAVLKYVAANYAGQHVTKIDFDRRRDDVELTSGLELEFDKDGKFLRVDH